MGKHTLNIEYDYDFKLICISSHEKDYRICWALNNILELDLTKSEPLEIKSKKQNSPSFFSLFSFENADEFMEYFVISNFSENKLFDSNDNNWFPTSLVGLKLNIQIFDGFDKKAKIMRAKNLHEKTNMQYKEFEYGATLEFQNARTQYLNATVSIESRKKSLALAERIYEVSNIKFKEGIGSSLEITSAERDVYQSQANLLDAQIQLINAKIDLDKSMGKL